MSPSLRIAALVARLQKKTGGVLTITPDGREMRLVITWSDPGGRESRHITTYSYGTRHALSGLEYALRDQLSVFRHFVKKSA